MEFEEALQELNCWKNLKGGYREFSVKATKRGTFIVTLFYEISSKDTLYRRASTDLKKAVRDVLALYSKENPHREYTLQFLGCES